MTNITNTGAAPAPMIVAADIGGTIVIILAG